ncbi:sigma-54-dependent Fis family transcriptional regulator, partial [Pseudomonas sp. MPR-R5A]
FMSVNCGAIPEALFESELFGYEEGAFTGARKGGKPGKFELAHNGTILLDEIGEMPLMMQTKLLRVLQEKEAERVGGCEKYRMNARIIAATNRNLKESIK